MHPLLPMLLDAAEGRFPPVDGAVEVLPADAHGTRAIVEFTGHAVVLTDRPLADLVERGADGFGGVIDPRFVAWLGAGAWIGTHDAVLVARGTGGGTLPRRDDLDDHPRVRRSRLHRSDVSVHGDERGLVTLGRGLAMRRELSVELLDGQSGTQGAGRALIAAGLALVPAGAPLFAQVAPGNAASLRAFLSCGFVPIGAEILLGGDA